MRRPEVNECELQSNVFKNGNEWKSTFWVICFYGDIINAFMRM